MRSCSRAVRPKGADAFELRFHPSRANGRHTETPVERRRNPAAGLRAHNNSRRGATTGGLLQRSSAPQGQEREHHRLLTRSGITKFLQTGESEKVGASTGPSGGCPGPGEGSTQLEHLWPARHTFGYWGNVT